MYKVYQTARRFYKSWEGDTPDLIDSNTREQISKIADLPFVKWYPALMPDAHVGIGSCIGAVIPTTDVIIPSAVGVDIGCGMLAVPLGIKGHDIKSYLHIIFSDVQNQVPMGKTSYDVHQDRGGWRYSSNIPEYNVEIWCKFLQDDFQYLCSSIAGLESSDNYDKHLGTLGGGNHFIELSIDETDNVWLVIHSGSRGIGAKIGNHFIKAAKEEMKKWYIDIDSDLSYIPQDTPHYRSYILAMNWAQRFAKYNRLCMMHTVETILGLAINNESIIDCHHNYVARETHNGVNVWITRKGAIRADLGQKGIIPGSMGERTYIVEGLGNRESYLSASHGAGRSMSRKQAKSTYNMQDFQQQTVGIISRKDTGILDEIPAAYKNLDDVMKAQNDLVHPIHTLTQLVCWKG